MSKVIIHVAMSLDGFIASPNDDVAWSFRYGSDQMASQVMQNIGAVVLGNRGFREGTMNEERLPYGGMQVPQFVVTHRPRQPLTIGGLTFYFITSGIENAVEMAKAEAGEKDVALLGASIDQQCLKLGLADEIVVHLCPLLLNEGIRLFDLPGTPPIELERTELVSTAGITSLRFRIVK